MPQIYVEQGIMFKPVEPGQHRGTYRRVNIDLNWRSPYGGWDVVVHTPRPDGRPYQFYSASRTAAIRTAIGIIDGA